MKQDPMEKEQEDELRSGSKESVNHDKKEVIRHIDKNKDGAINHELHPDHRPKTYPEFKYDEGTKGPSSD